MNADPRLVIPPGKRVFLTGRTGSGKTIGAYFLLVNQSLPVIALDTKIDENLPLLPNSKIVEGLAGFNNTTIKKARAEGTEYFIVRPTPAEMSPETLDDFLHGLYDECRRVCVYVDEGYQVHTAGRAGPGLVGLLTRGRSRRITVIVGAQRPAWVSLFCMSEADYFMIYDLNMEEDRRRIQGVTGLDPTELEGLDSHAFLWWDVANANASHFGPVPLPGNYEEHHREIEQAAARAAPYRWV